MLTYRGLTSGEADHYRNGGADAYGRAPEYAVSDGQGQPCRHCLRNIPEGRPMLVLAHRPFGSVQPYAETGPIFLCADKCEPDKAAFPEVLTTSPDYLLKGYGSDERIVYGTGAIVDAEKIPDHARTILDRDDTDFVDVRSARNNCWQLRITSR